MINRLRSEAEKLAAAPYTVVAAKDETTDGQPIYLLSHPELPGCMAQGADIDEARASLDDARLEYILSLLEDGLDVPVPQLQVTQTISSEPNEDNYVAPGPPTFMEDLSRATQPESRQGLGTVSVVTP